jgi:hypothetical protein
VRERLGARDDQPQRIGPQPQPQSAGHLLGGQHVGHLVREPVGEIAQPGGHEQLPAADALDRPRG